CRHAPAAFARANALAPDEADRGELERRPEDAALALDDEPLFAKRSHARKADSLPLRNGLVAVVLSREAPERVFLPTIQNHGVPSDRAPKQRSRTAPNRRGRT